MARAYPQSQLVDDAADHDPSEWQTLRQELVTLLQQVDSRVSRGPAMLPEARYVEPVNEARHRDALRSVQRAITRSKIRPRPRRNKWPPIHATACKPRSTRSARGVPEPAAPSQPAPAPAPPPPRTA